MQRVGEFPGVTSQQNHSFFYNEKGELKSVSFAPEPSPTR